ncbi:MAG TPA: hypothetical protein VMB78_01195 [Dissulfurispiraceae bacterium]|nr:hypothetical protein [Dissulfurispiraceae bacterium]
MGRAPLFFIAIRGSGIIMFDNISLNYELQLLVLVTALGKAYNNLDVSCIEHLLDENVIYESQQVLCPLKGREAVLDYLLKKFITLRNTPGSELIAELGFMGSQERAYIKAAFVAEGQPCLIMSQGEKDRKLAVVLVDGLRGKIARVELCTVAPHWSQVHGTGEYPE